MTEPVAYRVDGTFYNNLNDAEYAAREINHLRKALKIDNGLIPKLVYIEPLYEEEQLQSKIQLTNSEYELLAKVCRGIAPFNKIESNIEIVPDMKWFVRSKETNRTEYNDFLLIDSERIHGWYPFVEKKIATQFDTEEQAELWTNPLTEAVHLPVEEKKQ